MQEYVNEDTHITLRDIADTFDISYGSAQAILTERMGMQRVCARWVPKLLPPEQMGVRVQICTQWRDRYDAESCRFLDKIITCDETRVHFYEPENKIQSSVWKHKTSPSPIKARLSKSVGKVICIIFFTSQEIILTHMVPEHSTVNGDYYSKLLKYDLKRTIRKKRQDLSPSGFLLHHDNAPAHTSKVVMSVQDMDIETLPHQPYSPDLAPSDYWLFPNMKDSLC